MELATEEGENRLQDTEVKEENLTEETVPDAEEEDEESLPHSEILDIFEEGLARLVQDPLLCDLPIQVTLEEVNSQIALEYGQAMTVKVVKADGEIMPIVVVQNATVLDLKKAICRFMELKQQREGGVKHVSWRYVWRTYYLVFQGEKLEDDSTRLKDYGIRNRDEVTFMKKLRKNCSRADVTMNSPNGEATNISMELKDISLQIQQLQEKKKIMRIFQEIRNRTNFGQTEEAYAKQKQIKIIDDELRQLRERQAELQKRLKGISAVTGRDDQKEEAYARQKQMNIIGNELRQLRGRQVEQENTYVIPIAVTDGNHQNEKAYPKLNQKNIIGNELRQLRGGQVEQQNTYEIPSAVTDGNDQNENANPKLNQININESELRHLRGGQVEQQNTYEIPSDVTDRNDQNETASDPPREERNVPEKKVVFVEAPPSYPAPSVILDTSKLPPEPSRTQCPGCQQFVVTETITSVSSVTWLVCVMTALLGCVAGCCLIPFCSDKFKSITHRCPKCRTSISTLKKL
ncbi:hypothetical protein OJAV_G00080610 [Oryzias javanicus]|uniref:Ubiquitin-like domain-containing protein n=1 Tax=Oryzias javanicus TaxID=123683 RepID=A0A437D4U8_ORYJA|nr:hypothetical protein OJAV_G00080610 [Oryzias javanicus]